MSEKPTQSNRSSLEISCYFVNIQFFIMFYFVLIFVQGSPDATKAIMLQHISQIGPVLHEYEEFISVIQAGFIGTWGKYVLAF